MACEVCQHCETSVEPGDGAVHNGLSYHKHCRQCYVCGETDLRNAETFCGVIFCSGCSQRIFQGCSSARQSKSSKTRRRSPRQKRRRRHDDRLEMMMDGRQSNSVSSHDNLRKCNSRPTDSPRNRISNENELKKHSAEGSINRECGTTTDVTQETSKRIKDHNIDKTPMPTPAKPRKKRKTHKRNKHDYSDLRIAELGASVEIANVALRKQSEIPVIIKSETSMKRIRTRSLSFLNQESDESEDSSRWRESLYSSEGDLPRTPWMQRGIGSILKIPLRSFKRNILDRSSLVSVFASAESYNNSFLTKLKMLFNEEVTEHQRNGVKKLYSTINRRNKPCRMGWLHLLVKKPEDIRCKHFKISHSYRCMRDQVMRLAGPTRSELAIIRGKILHAVSPTIIKDILNYNKKYSAILSSQAYRRD